jgi:hypothetical protein
MEIIINVQFATSRRPTDVEKDNIERDIRSVIDRYKEFIVGDISLNLLSD